MQLQNHIQPTMEQLSSLLSNVPTDQPIDMVNIIRYKEHVPEKDRSGADIYFQYTKEVNPLVNDAQGKLIWSGHVMHTMIGSTENPPDLIFVVRYPSIQNLMDMIQRPEYAKISKLRTISIEYGGLIVCKETGVSE
jgi:hypothetical protein